MDTNGDVEATFDWDELPKEIVGSALGTLLHLINSGTLSEVCMEAVGNTCTTKDDMFLNTYIMAQWHSLNKEGSKDETVVKPQEVFQIGRADG
jgi:hypothetical protein